MAAQTVAKAWGWDQRFNARYPFTNRIQLCLGVAVMHADTILSARNRGAMARTIMWRAMVRYYRDEFPKRECQPIVVRDAESAGDDFVLEPFWEHGLQLPNAEIAVMSVFRTPHPNVASWLKSAEAEQDILAQMEQARENLPQAIATLQPLEQRIVRSFYGLDSPVLAMRDIAAYEQLPISTAYRLRSRAIDQLREILCPCRPVSYRLRLAA